MKRLVGDGMGCECRGGDPPAWVTNERQQRARIKGERALPEDPEI